MTDQQAQADSPEGWQARDSYLRASFATGTFEAGVAFVNAIAPVAEEANHHPDIELTYPSVAVALTTHDAGGLTQQDIDLAVQISALAEEAGIKLQ